MGKCPRLSVEYYSLVLGFLTLRFINKLVKQDDASGVMVGVSYYSFVEIHKPITSHTSLWIKIY